MIETRDLTKKYGELFAIKTINLNLNRGDLFGFIGPNGAGKTTTMRILATLLNPTWGEAYVGGHSIYTRPKEIRRMIGYMPDFFGVYDDMKVIEYLEFFAAAYRIRGPKRRQVCDGVLDLVELGYKREALVTSLSRGRTHRRGLARGRLPQPRRLRFDDPGRGPQPAPHARAGWCERDRGEPPPGGTSASLGRRPAEPRLGHPHGSVDSRSSRSRSYGQNTSVTRPPNRRRPNRRGVSTSRRSGSRVGSCWRPPRRGLAVLEGQPKPEGLVRGCVPAPPDCVGQISG